MFVLQKGRLRSVKIFDDSIFGFVFSKNGVIKKNVTSSQVPVWSQTPSDASHNDGSILRHLGQLTGSACWAPGDLPASEQTRLQLLSKRFYSVILPETQSKVTILPNGKLVGGHFMSKDLLSQRFTYNENLLRHGEDLFCLRVKVHAEGGDRREAGQAVPVRAVPEVLREPIRASEAQEGKRVPLGGAAGADQAAASQLAACEE